MELKTGNLVIKPLMAQLETMAHEVVGRLDTYVQISHGGKTHRTRIANDMGKNPNWLDALEFRLKNRHFIVSIHEKDSSTEDYLIGSNRIQIENVMLAKVNYSNWFPIFKDEVQTGLVQLQFEFYPEGEKGYGMQMELTSGINSTILNKSVQLASPQSPLMGSSYGSPSLATSNILKKVNFQQVESTVQQSNPSLYKYYQSTTQSQYVQGQPSQFQQQYQPQTYAPVRSAQTTESKVTYVQPTYQAPAPVYTDANAGRVVSVTSGQPTAYYAPQTVTTTAPTSAVGRSNVYRCLIG